MTHPEELLAGYVDGTLSSEDRAVVDAHLSTCERCRREVAQARVAVAALGGLPEAHAPSGLGARAMAELGSDGGIPKTTSAPRWQRWAAPAAAAAAIILVGDAGAAQDRGRRHHLGRRRERIRARHRGGVGNRHPRAQLRELPAGHPRRARLRRGREARRGRGGRTAQRHRAPVPPRARQAPGPRPRRPHASGRRSSRFPARPCA